MNKVDFKNIIKIACVYTGAIIGAGFASGKEICCYFVDYGIKGIVGLIISGIIFGLVGWAVLDITYKYKIKNYKQFSDIVLGKKLGTVMEIVSVVFMFILFSTMISAVGALAKQVADISQVFIMTIFGLICVITFAFDIEAIVVVNSILCPVLVLGAVILGLYAFFEKSVPTILLSNDLDFRHNFIVSSIIYVAYNIITSISVLSDMGSFITSKKVPKYGGLIGGFTLGIIGICLGLGLMVNYSDVYMLEIPLLKITKSYGLTAEVFYIIIILIAIYTTAVINGYSAMIWFIKKFRISKIIFICLFLTSSFLVAQLQFSKLVSTIYPIFGYVGMFQIIVILMTFYKVNSKNDL